MQTKEVDAFIEGAKWAFDRSVDGDYSDDQMEDFVKEASEEADLRYLGIERPSPRDCMTVTGNLIPSSNVGSTCGCTIPVSYHSTIIDENGTTKVITSWGDT